jgi:glycosyltransferase involved in cell wall biosynthesis
MSLGPLFTIILPTRNAAHQISGALESLAVQTERAFEVLVVDGASGDDTLARVDAVRPRLPAVQVLHLPARGVYNAVNRAVTLAQGQWLHVLGADDRLHAPDTLARLRAALEGQSAALVYGDVRVMGPNAMVASGARYGGPFTLARLLGQNICQQAILYRRDLLARCGPFNEAYPLWADWDLAQRVFLSEPTRWLDIVVADYAATGISSAALDQRFIQDQSRRMRALWLRQPLGARLPLAWLKHRYWVWRSG